MSSIKKFISLGVIQLKRDMVYRADFLFSLLVTPALLFVSYFIWKAVFSANPGTVAGFTFEGMMGYFVYSQLISIAIFNMTAITLQEKVQSGDFSGELLKPINPFSVMFAGAISSRSIAFVLEIIPLAFFSWLLFHPPIPQGVFAWLFALSVLLSFVLNFLLSFLVGLLAFWTIKTEAFQWLTWIVLRLFSGEFFPLALLPNGLQTVSHFLPFEYLRYRVVMLAVANPSLNDAFLTLAGQIAWIGIIGVICIIVWGKVLRRFAVAGG